MEPTENPREFFLRRILREAAEEGRPLTELEQWYLLTGPGREGEIRGDEERMKEFESTHTHEEFAGRVTSLLRRAMVRESVQNPDAAKQYAAKLKALGNREEDFGFWMMCVPAVKPGVPRVLQWVLWVLAALVVFGGIWLFAR